MVVAGDVAKGQRRSAPKADPSGRHPDCKTLDKSKVKVVRREVGTAKGSTRKKGFQILEERRMGKIHRSGNFTGTKCDL